MKKIKGFTLIELIVVIAIIGILAAILIPVMNGVVNKGRVSRLNSNAKSIYNGAQLGLNDCNTSGITILPNTVYTGSSDCIAHPSGSGNDCDLTNYLGEKFDGYFLFLTDNSGYGCIYALWSERPIPASAASHMTKEDVQNSVSSALPMGCHPLKFTS